MTVRSHKLKLVMSPISNSRAECSRQVNALFRGSESFIPEDILKVVRTTLFAANREYKFPPEDFADIAQSCLAKVWQKEDKFKTELPAYFGRIVKNTVVDYFRRSSRDAVQYKGNLEDLAALEVEFREKTLRCHYSKSELFDLIAELDHVEAAIVFFKFYEGLTYQQISVHLAISVSAVKRRLAKALINLRRKLGSKESVVQPLRQV